MPSVYVVSSMSYCHILGHAVNVLKDKREEIVAALAAAQPAPRSKLYLKIGEKYGEARAVKRIDHEMRRLTNEVERGYIADAVHLDTDEMVKLNKLRKDATAFYLDPSWIHYLPKPGIDIKS